MNVTFMDAFYEPFAHALKKPGKPDPPNYYAN